jgi:type 1 fimbriae regulatory protein FimB/type 1 fimbriae regulatory protein FimE
MGTKNMLETRHQIPKTATLSKTPQRKRNSDLRAREHLTATEVNELRKAARAVGRKGHRDDTLILLMFRHALRVSETIALRWEQVDLNQALLHVRRIKNGKPSTHPLRGVELRALRQLKRECSDSPYVFISERKAPLTARTVHHIIARAGELAQVGFTVHPHMLRHSTGFYLANKGEDTRAIQSYMGHSNIKNTTIYTELSPQRFNKFFND